MVSRKKGNDTKRKNVCFQGLGARQKILIAIHNNLARVHLS